MEQQPWLTKPSRRPAVKVVASNGLTAEQLKMIVFMSTGLVSKAAPGALYLMLFKEGKPQVVKLSADAKVVKHDSSKKAHGAKITVSGGQRES